VSLPPLNVPHFCRVMEGLEKLNNFQEEQCKQELFKCCASKTWAKNLTKQRPYKNVEHLMEAATREWFLLAVNEWLEAFSHHPKIGDKLAVAKKENAMGKNEQSSIFNTSEEVLNELVQFNELYFDKFGFIFLIFAEGKSAEFMLSVLKQRINNSREQELQNAAAEQDKIARRRLEKMFQFPPTIHIQKL